MTVYERGVECIHLSRVVGSGQRAQVFYLYSTHTVGSGHEKRGRV